MIETKIEIDWSNYERLCGEVKGVPDRTAYLLVYDLEGIVKEEAPVGMTGRLQANWEVTHPAEGEYTYRSLEPYSAAVNDGSRPHNAPIDAIKEWAQFRGLPWFPIWKAIATRGTKANPFAARATERANRRLPLFVNQAINEMRT
jgi:hypothetical protein